MSRIFWDTNLYIYLLKGDGPLHARVLALREAMLDRGDELLTSALTLGEILVKPLEHGDEALAARYEDAIVGSSSILDFDVHAAKAYASLRSDRSIHAPDAVQLACAAANSVDVFITNDERLSRKRVNGIQFIVSLSRAPL